MYYWFTVFWLYRGLLFTCPLLIPNLLLKFIDQVSHPQWTVKIKYQNLKAFWIPRWPPIFLFCCDSWVVNVRYYWWITCDDLQSYNLHTQVYTVEDKTEMEVYAPTAKETRRFYNPTWFSSLDLKEKIKASWSKVPPVILTTSFSMYSVDANKSLNAWTEWCFVFKAARINTKQF